MVRVGEELRIECLDITPIRGKWRSIQVCNSSTIGHLLRLRAKCLVPVHGGNLHISCPPVRALSWERRLSG